MRIDASRVSGNLYGVAVFKLDAGGEVKIVSPIPVTAQGAQDGRRDLFFAPPAGAKGAFTLLNVLAPDLKGAVATSFPLAEPIRFGG